MSSFKKVKKLGISGKRKNVSNLKKSISKGKSKNEFATISDNINKANDNLLDSLLGNNLENSKVITSIRNTKREKILSPDKQEKKNENEEQVKPEMFKNSIVISNFSNKKEEIKTDIKEVIKEEIKEETPEKKKHSKKKTEDLNKKIPSKIEKKEPEEEKEKNEEPEYEDEEEEEEEEEEEVLKLHDRKIKDVSNKPSNLRDFYDVFVHKTENKYTKNPQMILLILSLKKAITHYHSENTKLKKENLDSEEKEIKNLQTLKNLTAKIEELEYEQELLKDEPAQKARFNLDDLNKRIDNMNKNLEEATANNAQIKFLEQIISENKEFVHKSSGNSAKLREMTTDLKDLKVCLKEMNKANK